MIRKQDLTQITYQDFGEMLARLESKVSRYCAQKHIMFDLVVPILRSGAFTGMHLASKLKVTNILPVQYKYQYLPKEKIIKKFEAPTLMFDVPEAGNILVCDSNTVWGGIARRAINDIKNKFPLAKIYFASANLDQSITRLEHVEDIFYGTFSNEKGVLTAQEAKEKGITNDVFIFPWEDLEEEWRDMKTSQKQGNA